jgi:hypothetical protein
MGDVMSEKMREDFEKFAADHYLLCERSFERDQHQPDEYLDTDCQLAWEAWQASRAALVVELPSRVDTKPYACYENGWNDMHDEARDAIEAAGVKVTP